MMRNMLNKKEWDSIEPEKTNKLACIKDQPDQNWYSFVEADGECWATLREVMGKWYVTYYRDGYRCLLSVKDAWEGIDRIKDDSKCMIMTETYIYNTFVTKDGKRREIVR